MAPTAVERSSKRASADAAARIDRAFPWRATLPKAIRATVERALPQATISGHYLPGRGLRWGVVASLMDSALTE
ncbi:MAG: hypothetical protein IPG03_10500 [Candidatus Microthrix sp.]|nr:hypothetical protein [Candidatus Microthrix sp.]MBK6502770.1 hypothetical protein [Candidatus Microthrix sp.]